MVTLNKDNAECINPIFFEETVVSLARRGEQQLGQPSVKRAKLVFPGYKQAYRFAKDVVLDLESPYHSFYLCTTDGDMPKSIMAKKETGFTA